jgi:DNA adenine methylase
MKPFLKWVGGKTQILDKVLASFPRKISNYYEPFLGGGSVLLGVLSSPDIVIHGEIYASDANPFLIGLYTHLQQTPEKLIDELKQLCSQYEDCPPNGPVNLVDATTSQESFYYWTRKRLNGCHKGNIVSIETSAMFLFLNKTCFRGLYREGPHGFNVPFGHYKHPTIFDEDHLRSVSELIQGVHFSCSSFGLALSSITCDDFVYLDPPYAPECESSFVKYSADGFGADCHKELFDWCRKQAIGGTGASFVMSNADVEFVKKEFRLPGVDTRVLSCRRAIHSTKPDARTNEVIISFMTK